MTSKKTTTARPTCGYPGCDQLAAPAEKPGRPPEYCAGRGHTRASAWKETPTAERREERHHDQRGR